MPILINGETVPEELIAHEAARSMVDPMRLTTTLLVAVLVAFTASAQTPPASFLARSDYFAEGPNNVVIADVNNDGIPDIISDGPSVFLGNGDGTFRPVVQPRNNADQLTLLSAGTYFHKRIRAGEINLADNALKIVYGRVHWEQLLRNLREPRFEQSLKSLKIVMCDQPACTY